MMPFGISRIPSKNGELLLGFYSVIHRYAFVADTPPDGRDARRMAGRAAEWWWWRLSHCQTDRRHDDPSCVLLWCVCVAIVDI